MHVAVSHEKLEHYGYVVRPWCSYFIKPPADQFLPTVAEYVTKSIRNLYELPVHIDLHCVIRENVGVKLVEIIRGFVRTQICLPPSALLVYLYISVVQLNISKRRKER